MRKDPRVTDEESVAFQAEAACSKWLISAMRPIGTDIDLAPGATLFQQGDEAGSLFALLSGRLEVSIMSASGRKSVLNVLTGGQLFGELSLISGTTRTATVSALERSRVLHVRRGLLINEMERTPRMAIELLQLVIGRGRWISEQFGTLAFAPLEVRMARRLLYLKAVIGDENGKIQVSQHALGEHAGATREAVSKILASWKAQSIVSVYRGGIIVLKPDVLADYADGETI